MTTKRENQGTPFVVWFILAFVVFVALPAYQAVAESIRAERARERREIEASARLKLLAEQQRLREAGAWLASAPRRQPEPTKPTGR